MKILAIDTATEGCSAAVYRGGDIVERFEVAPREHGNLILPMIESLLQTCDMDLAELDAIAFGRGPGAFTGVRIAAGVTQGIAYAAGLPVVAVSDLSALALAAADRHQAERILVCMDARMGEVYWSICEVGSDGLIIDGAERLGTPQSVDIDASAFGAGSGWSAYPELGQRLATQMTGIDETLLPHAADIARLAVARLNAGDVLKPAQAVPVYLRDEVAWKRS